MLERMFRNLFRSRRRRAEELSLDEVFIDYSNLPAFDSGRLEGRLETPLSRLRIIGVGVVFALVACTFLVQSFKLQVVEGSALRAQSEQNRLNRTLLIAERGVIYDRRGERLAWNEEDTALDGLSGRAYTERRGLGQLLGYVRYPKKDSSGFYFRTEYEGVSGIEAEYDARLGGTNGERLVETDASGKLISEHVEYTAVAGESVALSVDAEFSEVLHDAIASTSEEYGFRSGAGVVMDVETGEIIALVNYPSYDPGILAHGSDAAAIAALDADPRLPYLNRITAGLYTPGSVVKPFVAYAALAEGVIAPETEIVSTGQIVVPNPYNPTQPSIFRDWRAHGAVDARRAIAVSSNVYFYTIGGGFEGQAGLGIARIAEYLHQFGFGESMETPLAADRPGVVPDPTWKEEVFGEPWRLGDTYFTAIGQYGFQVLPLQMLRAYAVLANGGTMLTPHFTAGERRVADTLELDAAALEVVREGMRQSVLDGTARALNRSDVAFAGKTGTAQVGAGNQYINSWAVGYFPYESPRYVFVTLLEHGPSNNLFGAAPTMSRVVDWLIAHRPEYLGLTPTAD